MGNCPITGKVFNLNAYLFHLVGNTNQRLNLAKAVYSLQIMALFAPNPSNREIVGKTTAVRNMFCLAHLAHNSVIPRTQPLRAWPAQPGPLWLRPATLG
jgi:hypothetical protein